MRMSVNAGAAGEVQATMTQDVVSRWTVESVEESGAARLLMRTERIVMRNEGSAGQAFTYDSESDAAPVGMASLVAPMFDAMVEHPFVATMAPTGEISKVKTSKELEAAVGAFPGGVFSKDLITQSVRQSAVRFPAEPLAIGDKWSNEFDFATPQTGKMGVRMNYTYDGPRQVDGRELEALTPEVRFDLPEDAPLTIESKGSTGEVLFDRSAGRIVRSRVLQSYAIGVKVRGANVSNEIEQAIETRLLASEEQVEITVPKDAEPEVDPSIDENAAGSGG